MIAYKTNNFNVDISEYLKFIDNVEMSSFTCPNCSNNNFERHGYYKRYIIVNDTKKQIINEKNVLGFNFSINPLLEYKKQYNYFTRSFNELIYDYSYVKGFGYVLSFKEYTNKNHEKMCFIKVGDDTAVIDLVVHSSLYLKYKEKLIDVKGKYLYFEGNMQKEASCVIKKLEVIN